jgi:hypothetical protein
MNAPLTIGYMAATADIERRNRTQRDQQQHAALATSRLTPGEIRSNHALARFGGWLRGHGTATFAANRAEANCAAPAC